MMGVDNQSRRPSSDRTDLTGGERIAERIPVDSTTMLYSSGEYARRHPSLFSEDSSWKVYKMRPFIEIFLEEAGTQHLVVLDVGGGSGLVLKLTCDYMRQHRAILARKIAVDISSDSLKMQQTTNPDISMLLQEDVRKMSLGDKEVDLALAVDVIEHVPEPVLALREVGRVSRYAIIKIPTEDTFFLRIVDLMTHGAASARLSEAGHVNKFNLGDSLAMIRCAGGEIVDYSLANCHPYMFRVLPGVRKKLIHLIGGLIACMSPKLAAYFLMDYLLVLVRFC